MAAMYRLIADIQNASQMALLRQLTSGIAHEIKNPLNFVNNFALLSVELAAELEALLGQENVSAENASLFHGILEDLKFNGQKIKEHGQRADRVICTMLERGQRHEGAQRVNNVDQLIDEFLGRSSRAA
jgi:signal transduction histidine kinase